VVQAGSDSTLGITFIDGTVFGLSSNARMVLNEMIYDPNGSNNSSLLEKRSDLASPNGARLTDGLVNELTRQAPHIQAAATHVIGKVIDHVTKLTASSILKYASIILNVDDYVNKSDVVLNGLVYGSNQSSNPTLPSLIQGVITFLPDETAKSGDLKIDTPVASSGVFH
jgi:hypothetical protein